MTAANIHFTITIGGLVGIFVLLITSVYRLGRLLQKFDSHIEESNAIHRAIDKRLTYLERRRSRNGNS